MTWLNEFELTREVCRTEYSVTYQGKRQSDNLLVFLKLYPREPLNHEIHRFYHEASSQAKLFPPYFQQIFGIGSTELGPYLIQENLEGVTLESLLAGPPIGPKKAIVLVRHLALALRHAHWLRTVFCNLSPSNIFSADGKEPKITGFEYSKDLWFDRKPEGLNQEQIKGLHVPPDPISPEQRLEAIEAIGPATDIYAWGAITYQLMNWMETFPVYEVEEILAGSRVGTGLSPNCPAVLEAIVCRCLQLDPRERYQDGNALVQDLEKSLNSGWWKKLRMFGWR